MLRQRCWLAPLLLWMSFNFTVPSLGFLHTTNLRHVGPLKYQNSYTAKRRELRLLMSKNVTVSGEKGSSSNDESPMAPFAKTLDSFTSSSAYRTLLFTGALFSSQKVRDFLGVPGCLAIVTASFSVYFYETKFNYLVDVVTPKRQAALRAVRQYKTQQLSGKTAIDDSSEDLLPGLLDTYEVILREELETRVILPPNIWVIEMDPTQEDRAAAPQLLGLKITDQYTLEPISSNK